MVTIFHKMTLMVKFFIHCIMGARQNIVLPISTMAGSAEHNSHIHNKKKQQSFRSQMLEAIVI